MPLLRASLVFSLVCLPLACSDDDEPGTGAPQGDAGVQPDTAEAADTGRDLSAEFGASLACYDTPLPAAPDPMTIVAKPRNLGAVLAAGTTASALARDGGGVVATTTIDDDGEASFTFTTEGLAQDVYFRFEPQGLPTNFSYTGWPLFEDEQINFGVAGYERAQAAADLAGVSLDDDKGHIVVTARDCDLRPVEDVEFELRAPFSNLEYVAGEACFVLVDDLTQTSACGRMIAVNVDPGVHTLLGKIVNGPHLRTQEVFVEPGAITWVTMRPRRSGP